MRRSILLRGRRRAIRADLRRGLAGTALATSSAVFVGLVHAVPVSAVEVPPDNEPPYRPISLGEQARLDRCSAGVALHVGGPELKKVAAKALTGPPEELAVATDPVGTMWPLSQAMVKDRDYPESSPTVTTERRLRWEAANETYWQTGWGSVEKDPPQFGSDIAAFTLSAQRDLWAKIGTDGHAMASKTSLDRAKAVAAEVKGKDIHNDALIEHMLQDATSPYYRSVTASDIARLLRHGGFLAQTPAEDSAEFRMEVEALKVAWGSCDSRNPDDFYRVMSPMVVTAHMEWEAEYAAQAKPRADIVNAEVAAANEVRKATDAMIESLGQAWLADQILKWQKYWAGQKATTRPKPAVFTQATKDLAAARTRAADQAKLAASASAAAKAAADKGNTAQHVAWTIADGAKTPRGRGLLFAQQSVQVAKASAAAAEAAAKATLTASNAAKATVADSKALYGLAQTQSHAMKAEFRRVAAQEAAAQAKSGGHRRGRPGKPPRTPPRRIPRRRPLRRRRRRLVSRRRRPRPSV
ncbi:hypothetical protein ABZ498_15845 [Streptomyces lavendulocolor]|uniref:hypothetical protein n=1 Tax=Streptomyces lavendulocolor TaxID=67316 RepID=UPI0033E562BF